MAVGTGFGFDLSQLDAELKRADEALKTLGKTGKTAARQLDEAFALAKNGNIQDFISVIDRLSNSLGKKGYNHAANMVREIATETTGAIDRVNRFATLMQTISDGGRSNVKNGAIESLKYQLDEALSRLGVLNEQLQFFTKGEGAKAVGANVVDTSALQQEANQLRVVVELLQRRLEHEQALAALKQRSGAIENQQALNTSWQKMEEERTKQLQQQSINAKEANKAYEQAYNDRYQMYAVMYDKMWQEDLKHFEIQNANAKSGGQQYAKDYEDRQRYYERWINEQFLKEQENNKKIAEAKLAEEKRINQQISQDRIDQLGKESRERLKIEQMIRDTQRRNHEAREKELNDLFREQERQAKAQAQYDSKARTEKYKSYTTSYEGAIRTSDKANTLAKEIQAVKNLEAARAKLSKTDADYEKKVANLNRRIKQHNENIEKATKGTKELKEQHRSLGDAAGGVGRALAGMFSVRAIRGYINEMIKVRGEMELQQRSLQAILQDKDKADEIWQKTIDLAVKSPFRIKDLVTYTKQLAAYRVEADKLYDTNKMLADVSSGLGVDMSRLILAFGQVKAANYLRGTELRQFSEAGINMLGELSKYFTELEGRAVSVGDVFERISKRMVSFSDVEEIFKRITSEGGTFYRMQEIQSETLRGQISNLKDSVDIMINEMGKANDGVLKNMVSIFKGIVDNWRTISATVVPIIGALITRWSIFRVVTQQNGAAIAGFVKTFGKHFGVVITQLTRGTRVAKQFAKSTQVSIMGGWTTVLLSVAAAIVTVVKAMQNANRVKKELEKIDLSGAFDASRSVAEYKRLADVVSDTSKSYDEQQKALSTLKNKYADILPAHMLEAKTIKGMKGDYDAATQAIYDYIAAKTKEKQIGVIQTEFGTNVEDQAKDLADDIKKALSKVAPNITRTDVLPIVNKLRELIQVGDVDLHNVDETIQDLVMQFTGLKISTTAWKDSMGGAYGEMSLLDGNAAQLVVAVNNLKSAMDEVTSSSLNWMDSFIYQDFNKVKEGYEEQSNAIGKYYDVIRKYQEQQKNGVKVGDIAIEESEVTTATDALNKIFTDANKEAPKWNEIINEPFKLNEATVTANKLLWSQMIDDINKMEVLPSNVGAKTNYVEALTEEMEGFAGSAKQQEVARIAQELADSLSVSLEGLDELFLKSDESLTDYAKRITGTLEQYKQGVLEFDNDVKNGTKLGEYTEEQVGLMREQIPFLQKFLELFSAFLKPKKGKTEDTFTPMLRTVKELYTEFKKLQGSFDDLTAKEGAMAKFGDAFKDAFGKTPEEMGFDLFSQEGIESAYDYLIKQAPDAKKKIQAELAKGEVVWDLKLERKKEADEELKESIERMFDQYDLSLSLDKLNIPQDLAKKLFNIDTTSLDELRSKITSMEGEFLGKGMKKQYDEYLDKIAEMEQKAQEERLKTYVEYARKAIGERAKIKLEELRKLKEIEETFEEKDGDSEETRQYKRNMAKDASAQVKKEADQELKRLDWQEFEKSDMFVNLFKDLEGASDSLLNHAINKLQMFKEEWKDMPLEDVRQIVEKMNELEDALINIQPIQQMKEAKKKVDEAIAEAQMDTSHYFESSDAREKFGDGKKKGAFMQAIQEESVYQEQQKTDAQEQITYIETALRLLEGKATANDKLLQDEEEIQAYMKLGEQALRGQLTRQKGIVTNADKILARNEDIVDANQDYNKGLNKVADYMDDAIGMANDLYEAFKSLSVALGADEDSPAMIFADMGMNIMSSLPQMLSLIALIHTATQAAAGLGTAMNMAMGIVGLIVMGIQLVVQAINAIVSAADKKVDAQVERLIAQADELHEKYSKLADSIDEIYNVRALEETSRQLDELYEKEKRAIEAAIAARKSDKNISKEERKEIEDLEKRLVEMEEDHMETMKNIVSHATDGILDSVHDAAREFTDAWYEAYAETGNGLKGLEDNFDEMFMNLAKNQAAMQITDKFVKGWQDDLATYVNENDTKLTPEEAAEWAEKVKATFPELSAALEGFLGVIHEGLGTQGGGLSGLQKGIQGITEDQADILAAYWNSVRGYTASIDSKMDLILANLNVSAEDNPMLAQLRTQTDYLNTIKETIRLASIDGGSTALNVRLVGQRF